MVGFPVGPVQPDPVPGHIRLVRKPRDKHDPQRIGQRDQLARLDGALPAFDLPDRYLAEPEAAVRHPLRELLLADAARLPVSAQVRRDVLVHVLMPVIASRHLKFMAKSLDRIAQQSDCLIAWSAGVSRS